ncbi:YhfC family intramembrane metalloprotease [Paenibacillus elgii]|uniref:YhfC family intramembrane metalloprotease n=1 Tax=Paenibacillus elgii TaxID=189691 RepID=UPI0020405AFD|nr:YhfC family intramembrane metalloprotease [Paenibacillus elgii]MCM3272520.1 YhfC family intramembrane metalloprotease [Paenibacillus elgii]
MVSSWSILFMITTAILSIGVPAALFIVYYRKERFSLKAFGIGILVFILFSQVLEKLLHVYILQGNPYTASLMGRYPLALATYGALAAGIFEEAGRYIAFRFWLKRNRERKDGIALGLGHGGIEAVLIGVLGSVQSLYMSLLINAGQFDKLLSSGASSEPLLAVKSLLLTTPASHFALGGIERVAALLIQIAMSLIVLYAVRSRKLLYLAYAIGIHALIDFLPGLSQGMKLNTWLLEAVVAAFGLAALAFILKSKTWLK